MIDREARGLLARVLEVESSLKKIKAAQRIGGDGWITYSYTGSISVPAGQSGFIIFTQDNQQSTAVVTINQTLDMSMYSIGWRSVDGVHVFVAGNVEGFTPREFNYEITSTVKGTVSHASAAPF